MVVCANQRRDRWILHCLAVGVAVGAGALVVLHPSVEPKTALALGLIALTLVCLLPAVLWRVPVVSPAFVYAFISFVAFGLGSLTWLGQPRYAPAVVTQAWVVQALLVVTLGMAAFWAGYLLPVRTGPVVPFTPSRTAPLRVIWLVFLPGLGAVALLLGTGQFAYLALATPDAAPSMWAQWAITATGLMGIATNMAAIHAFGNNSRPHQRAMALMLLISMAVGVASGYKSNAVMPLVWVLVIYGFFRRRVPRAPVLVILIAALFLIPANLSYRNVVLSGAFANSGSSGVASAVAETVSQAWKEPLVDRLTTIGQWASGRFRDIDNVAAIVRLTPTRYPYLGVGLYAQAPLIAVVPRFLWPDKPFPDLGRQFSVKYLGYPPQSLTSVPVTNVGDLYMHFGVPGVAIGMAIWGFVAALFYRWFANRRSGPALLVFVAGLSVIVGIELDFVNELSAVFRTLLLTWLVSRFVYPMEVIHGGDSPS